MELNKIRQIRSTKEYLPEFVHGTSGDVTFPGFDGWLWSLFGNTPQFYPNIFGSETDEPMPVLGTPKATNGALVSAIGEIPIDGLNKANNTDNIVSTVPKFPILKKKLTTDLSGKIGNIVTSGIGFAGSMINAFGPVKGENELLADSGTSYARGNGFGYQRQENVNANKEYDELSKENTQNTLSSVGTGASLGGSVGSIFGPIGGAIGAGVGAIGGLIGGLFGGSSRKRRLERKIFNANQQAYAQNNFNRSSAHSDYLAQQYSYNHANTQDDILYGAKRGKDMFSLIPGHFLGKDVYTAEGLTDGPANARVAYGETIYEPTTGLATIVKNGRLNQDTNLANLKNSTVVLGNDIDRRTGKTFRDEALPYAAILEKLNNMSRDMMETLRGRMGLTTDNLLRELALRALNNIALQLAILHAEEQQNIIPAQYAGGKDDETSEIGWATAAIPNAIGGIASAYLYFDAKGLDIRTPHIYAGNPYAATALQNLASIRINPYSTMREMYDAERRNKYTLKNTGGLTGGLKYAAQVAAGIGTQNNIGKASREIQAQNNAYKTAYNQALLQTGESIAQRMQNANQVNEQMTAAAHAAKVQNTLMGLRNFMDYLTQYAASEQKRRQYNKMLGMYEQSLNIDRDKLNAEITYNDWLKDQAIERRKVPTNLTMITPGVTNLTSLIKSLQINPQWRIPAVTTTTPTGTKKVKRVKTRRR